MSGFSLDWLRLREPADHRARSVELTARLQAWCNGRGPLRIVDLGCGTGSNLRYLAPRLSGEQHWLLLDNDPALLEAIPGALSSWAERCGWRLQPAGDDWVVTGDGFTARLRWRLADLAHDGAWIAETDLVSAAALLDLVSLQWLSGALAAPSRVAAAAVSAPLIYDGAAAFQPRDRADGAVLRLVNRHQATDKGFGPALGPRAWAATWRAFRDMGYEVITQPSPWRLGPADAGLQRLLIDGWARAAIEISRSDMATIDAWRRRRLALLARGASATVEHVDLLALPPD